MMDAGAPDLLRGRGLAVTVDRVDRAARAAPFRDTASSAAAVDRRLAAVVGRAQADGALPIVLTGSCNTCMGVLAGFEHSRCGAVWIDAHADFNTQETAVSGFFPGMSLAIVTGHCYRNCWAQFGDSMPLPEQGVAMFGVRDLYSSASASPGVPGGEPSRAPHLVLLLQFQQLVPVLSDGGSAGEVRLDHLDEPRLFRCDAVPVEEPLEIRK